MEYDKVICTNIFDNDVVVFCKGSEPVDIGTFWHNNIFKYASQEKIDKYPGAIGNIVMCGNKCMAVGLFNNEITNIQRNSCILSYDQIIPIVHFHINPWFVEFLCNNKIYDSWTMNFFNAQHNFSNQFSISIETPNMWFCIRPSGADNDHNFLVSDICTEFITIKTYKSDDGILFNVIADDLCLGDAQLVSSELF